MDTTAALHGYPQKFRYFDMLVAAFVAILLVSNIVAPKFIALGPLRFSGAQLLFPLTYIFGDIFTEVYGYAGSRRAIWSGFFASALLAVVSVIVVALPPSPDWPHQAAYAQVLGILPRLTIASLIAYWPGEFTNSFVMARMKVNTNGRHLWMRTIGSTAVGQAVDTVLVMLIAFSGIISWRDMGLVMISGYIGKVVYEIVMTPVTYVVVNGLKRAEGVDILDVDTDFSPFRSNVSAN